MPSAHLVPPVLSVAAVLGLGACGAAAPPEVVVTVTATPTPASPTPAKAPSTSPTTPDGDRPTSDVEGRRYDFGLVTGSERAGDVDVLVLDRWTDPRVDDEVLAREGLTVRTWELGSDRYVNRNAEKTFDIPVREGARFLLNHCVASGEPVQTRSVGAAELAEAPEADRLLLVRLDDDGWATGGETFAGC
jgi:hypothetical protein